MKESKSKKENKLSLGLKRFMEIFVNIFVVFLGLNKTKEKKIKEKYEHDTA